MFQTAVPVTPSPRSMAVDRAAKTCAFVHYFGLSPVQASILLNLFDAGGAYRAPDAIAIAANSAPRAFKVRICELRQALETEAIDFKEGWGYRLTEIGLQECQLAMTAMKESLAA